MDKARLLARALKRLNLACEPFVSYTDQTEDETREMDAARDEALRLTDPREYARCATESLESETLNG